MLYIFHVDTGTMMTFDMNLALESVEQLKEVIERACRIPTDKQVLLVSGGESLDPSARVCSYSAGTDTNPIYLFSKCTIESMTPPTLSLDYGSDSQLKEQVEGSHGLPDTYKTVVTRVQLAQQFCDLARDQTRICERLVHDQHLQQQGWAAVLANLEDSTSAFKARAELFEHSFSQYLETREEFMTLLKNFREDLGVLAKIPIVPALLDTLETVTSECSNQENENQKGNETVIEEEKKEEHTVTDLKDQKESDECDCEEQSKRMTLLEWISAKDNQSSLQQVAEHCIRGLDQFDDRIIESLKAEVEQVLSAASKTEMKEIKGLEERLYGLEQLMFETKSIVQEQTDLAQSFLQNQTRASNLGDPSILPDLCASHRRQLQVMLSNQQHLLDIRGRCTRAKEELCLNLHIRLKWVMYVENAMCEVNGKLVIYHESLKRLRRHLDVIQQIHLAPQMYVAAVGEVVRRRTFSQAFLFWSSDLACQLLTVHNDEVARRRDFQSQFSGHFLSTLFPGMEDIPPAFATQAPSLFDSSLPKLSVEDIELLKKELPELTSSLSLPDLESITQFFLSKSVSATLKSTEKEEVKALEDQLVKAVTEAGLDSVLLQPADHEDVVQNITLRETRDQDRGFESETDTEEFEKVGQSPVDPKFEVKQTAAVLESEPSSGGPVVAILEVGVQDETNLSTKTLSLISPTSPVSQEQEFTTADFYIDESMPSSYTESNRPILELQQQVEDSRTLIALLQENLGSTRNEVERLRGVIQAISRLAYDTITVLKGELSLLRSKTTSDKQEMMTICRNLVSGLQKQKECFEESQYALEKDMIHRFTVDHELEMDALKEEMNSVFSIKEEEIKALKQTVQFKEDELIMLRNNMEKRLEEEVREKREIAKTLEHQLSECRTQCDELQRQVEAAEENKSQALQVQSEELSRKCKAELENLRSRFRTATAMMERSPSDSSLDRNEMAVDLIREKEAAIKAAVEQERARWEAKLEHELKILRAKADAERQVCFNEAVRKVISDKDRQIDMLRTREITLVEECRRHQETIRQLTDDKEDGGLRSLDILPVTWQQPVPETDRTTDTNKSEPQASSSMVSPIMECTDDRNASTPLEMSTSVSLVESSSRDAATSPEQSPTTRREEVINRDRLTRSQTSLVQQGKISITSCIVGDAVLVVWDENHRNYMILQEAPTLYFLHSDSLEMLGLKLDSESSPKKYYSTGEVADKEFCQARKSENRYRVPQGTKFYRVKVRPLQKDSSVVKNQHHRHHHRHHHHQQQSPSSQEDASK